MNVVEFPLAGERRGEEDLGQADGGVDVLNVVVILVLAAVVPLVGVVKAELAVSGYDMPAFKRKSYAEI